MEIKATIIKYKEFGDFFSPEYGCENEVLNEFKRLNQKLREDQKFQLIEILKTGVDNQEKYFVADLLYLYNDFDIELLEPMIFTAIKHKDPSFNRIFLNPCINRFGIKTVIEILKVKFMEGDILCRIGIVNLAYWLRPQEVGVTDILDEIIINEANKSNNLIEKYFYKLRFGDKISSHAEIPNNADELIKAISGQIEYEDILFNKLGWNK